MKHRIGGLVVVGAVLWLSAGMAEASIFRDIRRGLAYAGFDVEGRRDLIGDGITIRTATIFPDIPVDAGLGSFSLSGPVSLDVYSGGRALPVFKVRFQTALRSDDPAQPLNYNFSVDAGGQQVEMTGSLLVDGSFSFNGFGFYDFQLDYSSRQTVVRDGSVVTDEFDSDVDVGPIHIRGNVLADILAFLTSPVLGSDADSNPFVGLSAQNQLKDLFATPSPSLVSALADGQQLADNVVPSSRQLLSVTAADRRLFDTVASSTLIPEPAVLALLLVGLPLVVRHRRSRR